MKYPWMPLFWGDFLANTMHLSAQEAGAYLFLIAHAWENEGEIPSERVRLARIAHVRQDQWNRVWIELEKFFEPQAGGLLIGRTTDQWYTHRRVTDELRRLGKISNDRKAAALQKHSKCSAIAYANGPLLHVHPLPQPIESLLSEGREAATVQLRHGGFRDKGADYRAPPAKKSDNALKPIPDRASGNRKQAAE